MDCAELTHAQTSAKNIFAGAGFTWDDMLAEREKNGFFRTRQLITKIKLDIEGKFAKVESDYFLIRFRQAYIPVEKM
ncbi:hypothetical protein EH223_10665 [candidate division KSB1 bacterium]|nr:hypothetical protein [candidate division KSB1 bacterium]RQW03217.1 MAG: hypothetical protein EH223_10665 [candidate division KSB1 bacterium]